MTSESLAESAGERIVRGPAHRRVRMWHDEAERTRLMADIMRLIREPSMPRRRTRCAGMTLIGWLARRRQEESPHAIGIDEARESERRIRRRAPKAR